VEVIVDWIRQRTEVPANCGGTAHKWCVALAQSDSSVHLDVQGGRVIVAGHSKLAVAWMTPEAGGIGKAGDSASRYEGDLRRGTWHSMDIELAYGFPLWTKIVVDYGM